MRKVLLLTLGIIFVLSGASFAFHDAGVARCAGCHTMHNSESERDRDLVADINGIEPGEPGYIETWGPWQYTSAVDPDGPNDYLLIDATPSDVCLSCHKNYGQFGGTPEAPDRLTPAGNFIFLLEDNINDGHGGASRPIPGDFAGHNLNAPGYGLANDVTTLTSPGGSFPTAQMGCTSCHDPHGADSYRLLYGAGRIVQAGVATFANAAPIAYGPSRRTVEAANAHSAYVSGVSEWCGNCHGDFHNDNYPTNLLHPTDVALGPAMANVYNAYNGTSDLEGGVIATAYLPEVPFEEASFVAADTATTYGALSSSRVMCLTCHRAHATSAPNIGRWDFTQTLIEEDGDESGSFKIPNPYDAAQRSLCNKCHKKDEFDHGAAY